MGCGMRIQCIGHKDEPKSIMVEGDVWQVGDVRDVDDAKARRILDHIAFIETDEEIKSKKKKVV